MNNTPQSAGMTVCQIEVTGYRMPDMDKPNGKQEQPGTGSRATRLWLIAGGWLLFGLGLVGIFLPVLPTTVFWIGAVWCWSRSSPRLSRYILSHPRFGQPVALFLEKGQISRRGKWTATAGMAAGLALLHLFSEPAWQISLLVALTLALVGLWLWRRPEADAMPPSASELSFIADPETPAGTEGRREG